MKRLTYIFVCLVLSIGCSSITEDQLSLQECIDQYEAYDSYDTEVFPLGDHTEERYQADYDFYGTLLEKMERIAEAKLTSEGRISLKLLKFLVEDHRANFEFKTHLNPLLSDSGFHNSLVYRVRPLTSKKQSIAYLKMLQFRSPSFPRITRGKHFFLSQFFGFIFRPVLYLNLEVSPGI